jgi:hypothetical protein
MTVEERLSALTEILLNPSARLDERDDAAMYLGELGRQEAVEALLIVVRDPGADIILAASCGESLAEIALRNGKFDRTWLDGMVPTARMELIERLRHDAPDMLGT